MGSFLESWNDAHKKVILFSGVFDPVHKGHIAIAEEAYKIHGGTVVFLPERVPHHRDVNHKNNPTSYAHRLKMLNIATAGSEHLKVLDYPADQHWIQETFTWLGEKFPDRKLAWLVGDDVVDMIAEWPNADKMPELNVDTLIVANRFDGTYTPPLSGTVAGVNVVSMNSKFRYMESRFIRQDMLRRHTSLPDGLWQYIQEHKLYGV